MRLDSSIRLFIILVALAIAIPAAAQTAPPEGTKVIAPQSSRAPAPADDDREDVQQSLPPGSDMDMAETTILRDNFSGQYNQATLENLADMYWRLGAFDLQDDQAIANYIKIKNCPVYTDFVNDDMEWTKIVHTMREHVNLARDTFPLNYQFVIELHLGRYDVEQGGFPIIDRTGFKDVKRIEVSSLDARRDICYDSKAIKDYPKSLVILLPNPFTLDFVKLDEHVAQAYILRKKSEYAKMDEEMRVRRYERDAYLRLRVTFSQYDGNLRSEANEIMGILYGAIDGYEIFEDSSEKRLLGSVDLKAQEQKSFGAEQSSLMSLPVPQQPAIAAIEHPAPLKEGTPSYQTGAFGLAPDSGGVIPVGHAFTQ